MADRCRVSGRAPRATRLGAADPASGFGGGAPWERERIATPVSAAASESTVTTIPIGVSAIVSSNRVMPRMTLASGSKPMLVAAAGARAPVESASWLKVSEM